MSSDGQNKPQKKPEKIAAAAAREDRLKQALRQNLHRRKAQDRAREEDDPTQTGQGERQT